MRKVFLIGMLMISPLWLRAQLNNEVFETRMAVAAQDSSKLFLNLNFLGFGKNNEFFDTTVGGYTLLGYQVNPSLSYQLSSTVRFDAGVYVQKDFGNEDYSAVLPTLSLKIKKNDFSFVFGTLEGALNHRLIEPLYDFERVLNNRIENGVQLLWMKDDLFLDVWVDWNKMIYFNDPDQEEISGGLSFSKTLYRSGDFKVDVPVQLAVYHRGGQIDQNPNPVLTTTNAAIGLSLAKESSGLLSSMGLKSYFVGFNASSDELLYGSGTGIFINPYLSTNFGLTVMGSYWRGDKYLSKRGGLLYPSFNDVTPGANDEVRDWFMLRFLYDVKVANDLMLSIRAEPFYDTYAEAIEYSYGFYLNLNTRFFLVNAKK